MSKTYQQRIKIIGYIILIMVSANCISGFRYTKITEVEQKKIEYLLETLETSPCIYIRNGRLYPPYEGRDHVESKYYARKHLIRSAEDFIRLAATRSERTQLDYILYKYIEHTLFY